MIPISEAIDIIKRQTTALGYETVDLSRSIGRILAEDILADSDLPPFDRSQMDGFAVSTEDVKKVPAILKIVGESAAGKGWHQTLTAGEAIRIMTGAPVPAGADAVQKIEETSETDGQVTILEAAEKGKFIVKQGSEIKAGETVFKKGSRISANMIASLAAFGYDRVSVSIMPKVGIISTGSEIVPVSQKPQRDQIRDSNSVMLKVMCDALTADAVSLPLVNDEVESLKSHISMAAKTCEIVIISGGVSVGKYDFTKAAILELGGEIFFDKLDLKPGKPTVFAKLGDTLIFGLPGNPVSSAVTFYLFTRTAILLLQSAAQPELQTAFAVCAAKAKAAKERDTYLPAKLETDKKGRLLAMPLKWLGSSDFIGFANADALLFIPKGTTYSEGDVAKIVRL